MADRNQFPAGFQGNINMMPNAGGQFGMVPTGYPMMPQPGMQAAPPGAGMMPQANMMAAPMNQGGFVPGGMMVQGVTPPQGQFGAPVVPPAYTPRMAQEFKAKQEKLIANQRKLQEQQRKKYEAEMKARQYKEQQNRLKEFSTLGGRKMDADSMIKSIIGTNEPKHGPEFNDFDEFGDFSKAPTSKSAVSAVAGQDEGFGEFMTGPSTPKTIPPDGGGVPVANHSMTPPGGDTSPAKQAETSNRSSEKQKDLTSMMLQSCDLNAPQKAEGFNKKTSVKDIHPSRVRAVTFNPSQKSRPWTQDSEELTDLFTLPAQPAEPPPQATPPHAGMNQGAPQQKEGPPPALPPWATGQTPVPPVYLMVLEAVFRDGQIQTDLIYPILLRSGMPKDILGHIWALANRHTPGQLTKPELYLLLGLVALAQHGMNIMTLETVCQCPQAPVPNLGQDETAAAPPVGENQRPPEVKMPPTVKAAPSAGLNPHHQVTVAPPVGLHTQQHALVNGGSQAPPATGDDEFQDFVEAPSASGPGITHQLPSSPKGPVPSIATNHSPKPSIPNHHLTTSIPKPGPSIPSNHIPSVGPAGSIATQGAATENFADFKGFSSSTNTVNTGSPVDLIGDEDKYDVLRAMPNAESVFAAPVSVNGQSDEFADFSAFQEAPPSGQPSQNKSGPVETSEEFADFQIAPSKPKVDSNYSKLKALISDASLYKSKSIDDQEEMVSGKAQNKGSNEPEVNSLKVKPQELPSLSASRSEPVSLFSHFSENKDMPGMFDDIPDEKTPTETVSYNKSGTAFDWSEVTKKTVDDARSSTWSQPELESNTDSEMDWANFSSAEHKTVINPPSETKSNASGKPKIKTSQPTSKYNPFQKNYEKAGLAPKPGMSAYDMLPPDLDDTHDTHDDFDKFGTFHPAMVDDVGVHHTISSLHGGFDDFGDAVGPPKKNAPPSKSSRTSNKDTLDTYSVSSSEFSGWKSGKNKQNAREDSQSVTSLELASGKYARGSKEGTPSGHDSQSVSSLEMAGSESGVKSGTPQDSRSVASLELKAATGDGSSQEGQVEEDNFGEFSSAAEGASDFSSPVSEGPKDARELLTSGDLTTIGDVDRYSSLTHDPEDSDRHLYDWQRCLEMCQETIQEANNMFNSISSPTVCGEVVRSEKGANYLLGVVEIYRVVCRITTSIKAISLTSAKLDQLLKDIDLTWTNLTAFIASSHIMPEPSSLDFSKCIVRGDDDNSSQRVCGVCLLTVEVTSCDERLNYAGRTYHTSCANLWVNRVNSTLPALKLPHLL